MARRRSYAKRRLQREFREFVRDGKQVVFVFAGGLAVVTAVALFAEPSRFVQGMLIGVVATFLACSFYFLFITGESRIFRLMGLWAEGWVTDELKLARKRGHIWGWVDDIELGEMNIDHLVVAPAGVFAIETKWHAGSMTTAKSARDMDQARRAAAKAASILRSRNVNMRHEVQPVLAISGKEAREAIPAGGSRFGDVWVVGVVDLADWLAQHQTGRLGRDWAETLVVRVKEFRDSRIVGS